MDMACGQPICVESHVGFALIWRRIQRRFGRTIQFCGVTKLAAGMERQPGRSWDSSSGAAKKLDGTGRAYMMLVNQAESSGWTWGIRPYEKHKTSFRIQTMKLNLVLNGLFLAVILAFSTGCQSTMQGSYSPSYLTTYATIAPGTRVIITGVSDRRNVKPASYYYNPKNGDVGQFDKPVADIVRTALGTEFERGRLVLSDVSHAKYTVNCEILEFKATLMERLFQSSVLDMSVVLNFEWRDAATGALLASNERSERRSQQLPMGERPALPFNAGVIQSYGSELVNDMLPRVIEKELNLAPFLRPGQ
jgi:hypothetical protein